MKTPSFGWERLEKSFYRNRIIAQPSVYSQEYTQETIFDINYDLIALYLPDSQRIECYNSKKELMFSFATPDLKDLIKIEFTMSSFYLITKTKIRVVTSFHPLSYEDYHFCSSHLQARASSENMPSDHEEQNSQEGNDEEIWAYKNSFVLSNKSQSIYKFTGSGFIKVLANNDQYTLLTEQHWDAQSDYLVFLNTNSLLYFDVKTGTLELIESDILWQKCQIAPSSSFVFLYNENSNKLSIFSLSAKKEVVSIKLPFVPNDIKWCGNDAVACLNTEDDEVNVYGPSGKYITFWYPANENSGKLFLQTTHFGLKIYSTETVSLISRVEDSSFNIFRMGSTSPSAILADCLQLLNAGFAPRAIENLKSIDLVECASECIDAALQEFDSSWQKQLLTAAAFGKASILKANDDEEVLNLSHKFVYACTTIRLLNNLKNITNYRFTFKEFQHLGFDKILHHLIQCNNKFGECLKLCELFQDKEHEYKAKVMYYYAVRKILVSNEDTDDQLYREIISKFAKLRMDKSFHFSKLSNICYQEGRLQLAKQMILTDLKVENQLTPLLNLEEDELPLQKAHQSGSNLLELYVLLKLKNRLTNAQLFRIMALNVNVNNNLLMAYYQKSTMFGISFDFYKQTDDYKNLSNLIMEKHVSQKQIVLEQVNELYKKDVSLNGDFRQSSSKELDLILFQKDLAMKMKLHDLGTMTCNQTLKKLIQLNQSRLITKFLKKFSISDKVFYAIKSDVLIEKESFEGLWDMCNERRFANNLKYLFKKLRKAGYPQEASRYVALMKNETYETKLNLYLECKAYNNAIHLAIQQSDHDALVQISNMVSDKSMKKAIQEQLVKL
ncbi:hypothetical protein ACO0QE_002559 [Hanseniaspora vineae]